MTPDCLQGTLAKDKGWCWPQLSERPGQWAAPNVPCAFLSSLCIVVGTDETTDFCFPRKSCIKHCKTREVTAMRNKLPNFPFEKQKGTTFYHVLDRHNGSHQSLPFLRIGNAANDNSFFILSWMKEHGNYSPRPHKAYAIAFVPSLQAASLSSAHLGALTANTSYGLWKGYIKIIIYYSHSAKGSHWNRCSEECQSPGLLQSPLHQQEESH